MIDALGLFEIALLGGTACLSWMATGIVLHYLRRNAILDHPNERSSHKVPTPRGGGWGIMLTLLPTMALIGWIVDRFDHVLPAFAGAAGLMAISWMDDRRSRSARLRFGMQVAAVAIGLTALPAGSLVFQGWLPFWPDRIVAAVGWLWFVNLFNFMDGIDGLAGSEAASIGCGLAVVAVAAGLGFVPLWLALAAAIKFEDGGPVFYSQDRAGEGLGLAQPFLEALAGLLGQGLEVGGLGAGHGLVAGGPVGRVLDGVGAGLGIGLGVVVLGVGPRDRDAAGGDPGEGPVGDAGPQNRAIGVRRVLEPIDTPGDPARRPRRARPKSCPWHHPR